MKVKRFNFRKKVVPQRYRLILGCDYEQIHIFEYMGFKRGYVYCETRDIQTYVQYGIISLIGPKMSAQARSIVDMYIQFVGGIA